MISFYYKISGGPGVTKSSASMPIEQFFEEVKNGEYKGIVEAIRKAKTVEEQKELKKSAPAVTPSGLFSNRSSRGLLRHSGVVCIDIDEDQQGEGFNVDKAFEALIKDERLYAAHKSIRGKGLALYFKMENKSMSPSVDHKRSYAHIVAYLFKNYGLICDKTSDVPRLRFVSYDPSLYLNTKAPQWSDYTQAEERKPGRPKQNPEADLPTFEEVKELATKIAEANPEVLDDYVNWQKAAFILADAYEEEGRDIFHILSEKSPKYDDTACDRKYDNALKTSKGEGAGIPTLFFWAKEAGVELTKKAKPKLGGKGVSSEGENLEEGEEKPKRLSKEQQFKLAKEKIRSLNCRYDIVKRVERFDYLQDSSAAIPDEVTDQKVANLVSEMRSGIGLSITTNLVYEEISASQRRYDPVRDFLEEHKDYKRGGQLQEVLDSVEVYDEAEEDLSKVFIKKWMIGILGMYHGKVNELFLIMAGAPRTGKTSFFRNLLPKELDDFYSEGDHSLDKDQQLKMASNLLLINDEMTNSQRTDWADRKKACSIDTVKVRPAYGRKEVTLRRFASFGGSTNDYQFLSDLTGNRRFLPINLKKLDYEKFMSIDKKALFLELNDIFTSDRNSMYLSVDEMAQLESLFSRNNLPTSEEELVDKYFSAADNKDQKDYVEATNTEIRMALKEVSPEAINAKKLGMVLRKKGFFLTGGDQKKYRLIDKKGLITRSNI